MPVAVISEARSALRAQRTVAALQHVNDATVVPHDPAPITATLVAPESVPLIATSPKLAPHPRGPAWTPGLRGAVRSYDPRSGHSGSDGAASARLAGRAGAGQGLLGCQSPPGRRPDAT